MEETSNVVTFMLIPVMFWTRSNDLALLLWRTLGILEPLLNFALFLIVYLIIIRGLNSLFPHHGEEYGGIKSLFDTIGDYLTETNHLYVLCVMVIISVLTSLWYSAYEELITLYYDSLNLTKIALTLPNRLYIPFRLNRLLGAFGWALYDRRKTSPMLRLAWAIFGFRRRSEIVNFLIYKLSHRTEKREGGRTT